jgi:hypothetical protein
MNSGRLKLRFLSLLFVSFGFHIVCGQNVGIGQAAPVSKLDVNGSLAVGAAYSGVSTAPANGAIIQGNTGIGTAAPAHRLHVVGDVRFVGDFINQDLLGVHGAAVQAIPFTNAVFTPITGTTVSITIADGNGVNNSGVGGYFMILERDVVPAFTAPVIMTYTSGDCYIKTPNGLGSASIGYGGGGHVSYVDNGLTAGTTYYYRLTFYANGVGITSGTYDIYQRDLAIVQIKR